ncbi:MAG: hypothetical protein B6240_05245, partial [Desulfobacteraceae bacterium 4572_87]
MKVVSCQFSVVSGWSVVSQWSAALRLLSSVLITLLSAILLCLPAFDLAQAQAEGGFPMGINLTSVCYWSAENPFIDIFKQSQPWKSQRKGSGYGKGGALDLDGNGWVQSLEPGQWADALMCRGQGHYPAGEYVCLYDGDGRIEFGFDAKVKKRQKGRIVLNVSPSKRGILLRLTATNPLDPVRNIRVIAPGFENTHHNRIFHPTFIDRWRGFKVIRFMDWMRTNNSKVENW